MIRIIDKHKCCGCSACVQKCPMQCISMHEDEEGFFYPKTDLSKCIDCHICERVCPYQNSIEQRKPLVCYAAQNDDENIRRQSSSGGIFTAIAEKVLKEGGVVYGAQFDDNWMVIHSYTEILDGLSAFRGSKYVQSKIGDSFKQIEFFLREGRKVLFSGTPCQVLGLNLFLRKSYDNLLTVEVVCHGVPSPKIWKEYLCSLKLSNIGSLSHKDKSTGWRTYSMKVTDINGKTLFQEKASDNKYLMAFSSNLTLRPSCFLCPAKSGKSGADITLADYWGIEHFFPQLDDNKGTSFVCGSSEKGKNIIEELNVLVYAADYVRSIPYNSCIVYSTHEPLEREKFWRSYHKNGISAILFLKKKKRNLLKRIIKRLFI